MSNRSSTHSYRGQGMLEFALVLPLLLVLLVGIFEFGRIMFTYSVAIAASREAARYGAATHDIGGGISQYEDCQGIREAAKRFGKYAGINDSDITIQYVDDGGVYSTSCPPSHDVGLADSISVRVDTSISPFAIIGDFGPIPISSSSSRTILKKITLGESGTGAGAIVGSLSDVNFKTTNQSAIETQGTISVVVELNQTATDLVTIPFSTTGTATKGVDYTISSSPVTISPGQKITTIYITLLNDGIAEGDESLFIGIDTPTNATKGPQDIHMVTIQDPPLVSFTTASSTQSEDAGVITLTITLSNAINQDVTVPIISGGTAVWGISGDYVTAPQPVFIPAGTLSTSLTVIINDDLIDEDDEIAAMGLGTPSNALLGSIPMHLMTIQDNDLPPQVQFFTPIQYVSEDIGVFTTTLQLTSPSAKLITIPFTISGTTSPSDYTLIDKSPLKIPPGSDTVEINFEILEGDGMEPDETLILTLDSPTHAELGSPAEQTVIITESSVAPDVYFTSSSQKLQEENRIVSILVQMSNAWGQDVVIPYTVSGSAVAGAGQDYILSASSLTIPVGHTQGSIEVQLLDDDLDESDETIVFDLGTVTNGTAVSPTSHTVTITDNDEPSRVSFVGSGVNKDEGDGSFTVTAILNRISIHDVTVPLVFSGSATNPADFSASSASLFIPAGSLSDSISISIVDDVTFEADESILINMGSPTFADLGTPSVYTINIADDDLPPCDVGTHLLTIGTDTITWSVSNQGEEIVFTGGSISWPEALPNQPYLLAVKFDGSTVFSGSEKPNSFSFTSSEPFLALDTTDVVFTFDGALGIGTHQLQASFQNMVSGASCSVVETYVSH
ncbi:MAG: Calx-beta domain-containing protein [Anaerolineales bacterium]